MKKSLILSIVLSACGAAGEVTLVEDPTLDKTVSRTAIEQPSEESEFTGISFLVNDYESMPRCDDSRFNQLGYVLSQKNFYVCQGAEGGWVLADIHGETGKDGRDGVDGAPGVAGRDGVDGAPGVAGRDGVDGINGRDGVDGLNGRDGVDGLNGRDGVDGINGRDGVDGINGRDGVDGINGVDGQDGVSQIVSNKMCWFSVVQGLVPDLWSIYMQPPDTTKTRQFFAGLPIQLQVQVVKFTSHTMIISRQQHNITVEGVPPAVATDVFVMAGTRPDGRIFGNINTRFDVVPGVAGSSNFILDGNSLTWLYRIQKHNQAEWLNAGLSNIAGMSGWNITIPDITNYMGCTSYDSL